ncbi:MAG: hypothetical protein KKC85_12220 [Gammaproteobacteria bacterium]|nr:hypothetical protein [Gammaproteobacteria bacterium]MBU1441916.1 hypothetical protein [Gammaproteobacteria bacterium]MBU2287193.1 hypothetical protein [Gammaproteobacteria bacterium]
MHNGLPDLAIDDPTIPTPADWARWWDQDGECFIDEAEYQAFVSSIEDTALERLLCDATLPADESDLSLVLSFCLLLDRRIVMRKLGSYSKVEFESLDLDGIDLQSVEATEVFVEQFVRRRLGQIKKFEMTQCTFGPGTFSVLCACLNLCTALETVSFCQCEFGDGGAEDLSYALGGSLKTMTRCYLTDTPLGDEGAGKLAIQLQKMPLLRVLYVGGCAIGEAGALTLAKALGPRDQLAKLDLYDNPLGDVGSAAILNALKDKPFLSSLSMSNCGLGTKSLQPLMGLLASKVRLTKLALNDLVRLGPLDSSFGKALKRQEHLKLLAVPDCNLSDGSVATLIEAIESLTGLSGLNLGGQHFSARNANALARWLEHSKLELLDLSACGFEDQTSELLMRALMKNTGLVVLHFEKNVMGPKACAAAARLLKVNKTLKSLSLRRCEIDDQAFAELCFGLSGKTELDKLDVTHNPFGAPGLAALQKALSSNAGIRSLSIGANHLSGAVVRSCFAEVMEKNGSLTFLDLATLLAPQKQDWSQIEHRLKINSRLKDTRTHAYLLKLAKNFAAVTIGLNDLGHWIWKLLRDATGLDGGFVGLRTALRLSEVSRTVRFGLQRVAARDAARLARANRI